MTCESGGICDYADGGSTTLRQDSGTPDAGVIFSPPDAGLVLEGTYAGNQEDKVWLATTGAPDVLSDTTTASTLSFSAESEGMAMLYPPGFTCPGPPVPVTFTQAGQVTIGYFLCQTFPCQMPTYTALSEWEIVRGSGRLDRAGNLSVSWTEHYVGACAGSNRYETLSFVGSRH